MQAQRPKAWLEGVARGPKPAIWTTTFEPAFVEVAAHSGVEACFIDLEHAPLGVREAHDIVRLAQALGLVAVVRVPQDNLALLQLAANMGPDALLFPHVKDSGPLRRAVQQARYPPVGIRGLNRSVRSAWRHSSRLTTGEFMEQANEFLSIGLMVEEISGIDSIIELAQSVGADFLHFGPNDFTASGVRAGLSASDTAAKAWEFLTAAANSTLSLSAPMGHQAFPLTWSDLGQLGACMATIGTDMTLLRRAVTACLPEANSATRGPEDPIPQGA